MVLFSSSVLLCDKLRLHRSGILREDYSVKLEHVRLSVGVKVSPKQAEVKPVLLLNLHLEIHFFYIASDTNRVSTKTNQDVDLAVILVLHGSCHLGKFHCIWQHSETRFVLSLSLYPFSRLENAANTIRYSAVAHLKEPFVNIRFRHRPEWLLYTLRRRGCLSSNFFRCFGG